MKGSNPVLVSEAHDAALVLDYPKRSSTAKFVVRHGLKPIVQFGDVGDASGGVNLLVGPQESVGGYLSVRTANGGVHVEQLRVDNLSTSVAGDMVVDGVLQAYEYAQLKQAYLDGTPTMPPSALALSNAVSYLLDVIHTTAFSGCNVIVVQSGSSFADDPYAVLHADAVDMGPTTVASIDVLPTGSLSAASYCNLYMN